MTEHDLLDKLLVLLRAKIPGMVVKHADALTAGIPDVSVTSSGGTSWWEVKHAKPKIRGTGQQLLRCKQFAGAGICWYVVYQTASILGKESQRVCLVRPRDVNPDGSFQCVEENWTVGHDHEFVLKFIQKAHGIR